MTGASEDDQGRPDVTVDALDLLDLLDVVEAAAGNDAVRSRWPDVLGLAARVCADQYGLRPLAMPGSAGRRRLHPGEGDTWRSIPGLSDTDHAVLAFAEQFSLDVGSISADQRSAFVLQLGGQAANVSAMIFVMDFLPRSRAALESLSRSAHVDLAGSGALPAVVPVWEAFDLLIRAVPRLNALDPVTSELVRLCGARQHQCRLCQSLRSRPALLAGADDGLFLSVDHYETSDLSPHQKAALAFTDAMIWTPGRLDAVADRLVGQASVSQCVELVLDVTRNALNKVAVALGADAAHVAEGIEIYDVDANGELVYGLTLD